MPQSLSELLVHIVFSTKHREPTILPEVRNELWRYLGGTLNAIDCPVLIVGGTADHVHLLCDMSKNWALKGVIEEVKTESSKWLKKQGGQFADFHWQNGYGGFSVSHSNISKVYRYIETQHEHHHEKSFQDEFRGFLTKHKIEYDERYVWD